LIIEISESSSAQSNTNESDIDWPRDRLHLLWQTILVYSEDRDMLLVHGLLIGSAGPRTSLYSGRMSQQPVRQRQRGAEQLNSLIGFAIPVLTLGKKVPGLFDQVSNCA
jgi:hypothetical protein